MKHIPVLLDRIMETLGCIDGARILDCTFGAGGYSRAFLKAGASVTAFDRDSSVIDDVNTLIKDFGSDRFRFIQQPFSSLQYLEDKYDVIVFDLGISSMQIDVPERGFSFRTDAPLDMRMESVGKTAFDVIQESSVDELATILQEYGDVRRAKSLACAIKDKMPRTTFELKNLIFNPRDVAPVFQALRIVVNNEMGELTTALTHVPDRLVVGGKCICVTFHSLEDRIVKNTFRKWTVVPGNPYLPTVQSAQFELLKTFVPNETELANNSRARSAHMRGVVKLY